VVPTATFAVASLLHHVHNAVFLGAYPNMPPSLSIARIAAAWAATTLVGGCGYALSRGRYRTSGLLLLGAYGALGLLGLAHYHRAPVAAHSIAMNVTIWFEAAAGAALVFCVASQLRRRTRQREPSSPAG
jgi:hypothetical protein